MAARLASRASAATDIDLAAAPLQISPMTPVQEQTAREEALRTKLIHALRERRCELGAQLEQLDSHWGVEDAVYRFYHQSFKVCSTQADTL